MKKTVLIVFVSIFYNTITFAQPILKLGKEYHDFGELKEGDPASYEFEVTNTGNEPLIIASVQPSCGCTTPDWTREPIPPGGKGKIKASYGTQGRVGYFNKSITINTNSETPSRIIYIRGNVLKKEPVVTYTPEQLKSSPKIVLDKTTQQFGTIERNYKVPLKLTVKNLGRSDLKINDISSSCTCIEVTKLPEYIKPGGSEIVEILYVPNVIGETEDIIYFKSNDITNPSQKLVCKGKVVESLSAPSLLKENKTNVPFK